jgi:hypothetical protein
MIPSQVFQSDWHQTRRRWRNFQVSLNSERSSDLEEEENPKVSSTCDRSSLTGIPDTRIIRLRSPAVRQQAAPVIRQCIRLTEPLECRVTGRIFSARSEHPEDAAGMLIADITRAAPE